jgi:site-specific recombinase XerD
MKGAMKVELPNLLKDKDRHGKTRIYYRPPKQNGKRFGKMVRLYAAPGTPEFVAEYRDAVNRPAETSARSKSRPATLAKPHSLRWLVEKYKASANFLTLGQSTKKARNGILESICLSVADTKYGQVERGTLPFVEMRAKHVRAVRDEKIGLPEAANGRLKALGQVFAFAMREELVTTDPTVGVEYLPGNSEGFHTWTVEEVRQYEQRWPIGTKQRLALDILLYTGTRRSDAVKLGKHMEREEWLRFTETKNRNSRALSRRGKTPKPKHRAIPILPELRASIDACPSGHLVYLVSAHGGPYKETSFGNSFRDWCNQAGLPQCSAHGLRKAGATIASDNGATTHQLMAVYGWETLKQAELYTKAANRIRLARDAMHLLVPPKNKQSA